MAQHFDVSLKVLFVRQGSGIVRQMVFGGNVAEFLATEQPQLSNRRTDLVARNEDGSLHHVEFQTSNEAGFPLRMLEYYAYLAKAHKQHVVQTVLYLSREPMTLEDSYSSPSLMYRFTIINLRELDARPLLASPDWADNLMALFADGDLPAALEVVIARIATLSGEERDFAAGTLLILSGIIGMEETIRTRLQEVGMIDLMQNTVIGPMILKSREDGREVGRAEGRAEGREVGREEGKLELFTNLLIAKFGPLPQWAQQRLAAAPPGDLDLWSRRLVHQARLEDTLLSPGYSIQPPPNTKSPE